MKCCMSSQQKNDKNRISPADVETPCDDIRATNINLRQRHVVTPSASNLALTSTKTDKYNLKVYDEKDDATVSDLDGEPYRILNNVAVIIDTVFPLNQCTPYTFYGTCTWNTGLSDVQVLYTCLLYGLFSRIFCLSSCARTTQRAQ